MENDGKIYRPKLPELIPFQKRILKMFHHGDYNRYAISMPRGNGKSFLVAYLLKDLVWRKSPYFIDGEKCIVMAASIEQAKIVVNDYLRTWLEGTQEYRWYDSNNHVGLKHIKTGTEVRAISSNGKTAMGLVNVRWVIADEPGAWQVNGGQLMNDAIETAQGKPNSKLKIAYCGTLAPSDAGWWIDMVKQGTTQSIFVYSIAGSHEGWDTDAVMRKANPLMWKFKESRDVLRDERDQARSNARLKARFLSYRLNIPAGDEEEMLLTLDDWKRVLKRPAPPRSNTPIVGVDMGSTHSWSAAVAMFENQRVEGFAIAPGIPSIADQEKRDLMPAGTYQQLIDSGYLIVASGLRVPTIEMMIDEIIRRWDLPWLLSCDRFRAAELEDQINCRVISRTMLWSESSYDIRAFRQYAKDGELAIEPECHDLFSASLAQSKIKIDESGNMRMVKNPKGKKGRDDVAFALVLACGSAKMEWERRVPTIASLA